MFKKWCGGNYRKTLKWGGVLMALLIALGSTLGFLGTKSTKALPGDPANWTVESWGGLSVTVVSVQQNEVELVPVWDDYLYNDDTYDFGNYRFQVANTGDPVRVGVMVDGMQDGESYVLFDDQTLTSENNGQVFYENIEPHLYSWRMGDGIDCHMEYGEETCSYTYLTNEYVINVPLRERNWKDWVQKGLIVRPDKVGSSDIEIVSLQQNGEDVVLDKVGRHVNTEEGLRTIPQTLNEYALNDYSSINIAVKFRHLEVGKHYSYNLGEEYGSFTASSTEESITGVLRLNYIEKHIETAISLYDSEFTESKSVMLYFRVADADFKSLGDIVIDEISQGGGEITPAFNDNGGTREYTFEVNDVQPISISLHANEVTEEMNYYISYTMNGSGAWIHSEEPFAVSGDELGGGTVLTIPSGYGLSEDSPLSLRFYINTTGSSYGYGSQLIIYQGYGESRNSDSFFLNYVVDDELPRFDARIGYTNSDEEISDVINAKYHDENNPLWVRVMGERYDDVTNYEVHAKVGTGGSNIYDATFVATGAELNEGKTFILEDLVLSLPEFDPSGNTSGYEVFYDFSLEINGLEQRGTLYYMHNGYIYTVMTYAGGKVATNGDGIGGGGAMYMTSSSVTVRKSSLDGSQNAVIHYRGGGFDEDLSYNYAIYYNGDAGEGWWSAPAGTKIEEGVLTGQYLNNNEFAVNVAVPSNASESSMYSLVITRNGGLVIVSKDFLRFTDEPMLESFAFRADSSSFMQTGRESYRLARGVEATATLTGAGFDDEEEYKLWVSYRGGNEMEDEYGYYYWDEVDVSELDRMIVVTGAQLNVGYDYVLTYDEALADVGEIIVDFSITDKDNNKPDPYGGYEEGVYPGHSIIVRLVNEDEVFREDDGFQIDAETSEIIDVSQPDDPHEPEDVPVDIKTPGDVDVIVDGTSLTVVSRKPTLVLGYKDGHYSLVATTQSVDNDGEKTNSYDMSGYEEIKVVLKGDIDMKGSLNARDSAKLYYYLLSADNPNHRDLSELELLIADINNSGGVTARDASLLDYALLSADNPSHRDLAW